MVELGAGQVPLAALGWELGTHALSAFQALRGQRGAAAGRRHLFSEGSPAVGTGLRQHAASGARFSPWSRIAVLTSFCPPLPTEGEKEGRGPYFADGVWPRRE